MTPKMREALQTIHAFHDKFGYMPTVRELAAVLKMKSVSQAHRIINALIERGYLRRLPNRARALEIVENPALPITPASLTLRALVKEAHKRGLVIGHIVNEFHHAEGEQPRQIRRFKAITEEVDG